MGNRKEYKKTKYTGIYVKEDSKTKVKTYLARAKVNGVEIEQIVGYSDDEYKTNPSLAFNKRVELINKHKAGKSTKKSDNPTLDQFFHEYQDLRKTTVSESRYKNAFWFYGKYVSLHLRKKKLSAITTTDLQKIINQMIEDGKKGSTVKLVKEVFSPMLKKATVYGLIETNVSSHLEIPKFDNVRYFSLPDDKIKELIIEIMDIPDNYYRVMFMFLLRGRRSNEVRSLMWEDIDFDNKFYTIQYYNNKTRVNDKYSLDDELIEHLSIIREKSGLLFKSPRTGKKFTAIPRKLWQRIQDKVGIKMRIHDFRHLLGFTLINNDVPIEYISKALGHKRMISTQRYSNQKEQMAKEAVDTYLDIIR